MKADQVYESRLSHRDYEETKEALERADNDKQIDTVKAIVQTLIDEKYTMLKGAARRGDMKIAKLLVDHGYDVNEFVDKIMGGTTPLQVASRRGNVELVQFLINRGADIDIGSRTYYRTPLYKAVIRGRTEIVALLIQHGADPHRLDEKENSYLSMAASRGDIETAKLLLGGYGLDINHRRSKDGETPLMAAIGNGQQATIPFFLENGADPNIENSDKEISLHVAIQCEVKPENIKALLDYGADINHIDKDGISPLWLAVYPYGDLELLELLVSRGADIDLVNCYGTTPLMQSISSKDKTITKYLLEHGADVFKKDIDGNTVFHLAARKGFSDFWEICFKYQPQQPTFDSNTRRQLMIHEVNQGGLTPLAEAVIEKQYNVVYSLLRNGALIGR